MPMRIAVIILFAGALIGGGGYIVFMQLAYAHGIFWRGIIAAGFMVWLGSVILWEGLIKQRRRQNQTE